MVSPVIQSIFIGSNAGNICFLSFKALNPAVCLASACRCNTPNPSEVQEEVLTAALGNYLCI